jgi:hypothetical protein
VGGDERQPIPQARILVYAVLVALAFAAALIAFGNEAGWWRIDF